MAKMNIPASPTLYYTYYDNLKGADFTSDPTQVDKRRSPDVLNMIKDNGNIVKRKGWRQIKSYDGKVKKMFNFDDDFFCITENALYWGDNAIGSSNIEKCCVSKLDDKMAIFFGGTFYYAFKSFNTINSKPELVIVDMVGRDNTNDTGDDSRPYVPNVVISRNPDGTGGTFLESVNILTPNRTISFLSDGTSKSYHLYPPGEENTNPNYRLICVDYIKVEKMDSRGFFYELKKGQDYTCALEHTTQGFDRYGNLKDFKVSVPIIEFTTAPEKSYITGQDNIKVTFQYFHDTDGQRNKALLELLKCDVSIPYGKASDDRIFCVTGNKVYYSDINKLNYWPDDNYIIVGNDADIIGMTRVNEYLAVIKQKSNVDNTMFLVKGTEFDGETVFTVASTTGNVGALGDTLTILNDEPLFLSSNGICAISNGYVNTEKMIRNRSRLLDGKLLKEPGLENAVATSWNGYYVLCVNGHIYLLDGKQTTTDKDDRTNYVYEGYFWDSPLVTCVAEIDGVLHIGTNDGRIYRYSDDMTNELAYMDNPLQRNTDVWEGGKAIKSHWATPLDDDAKPQYFKNLNKKGTVLTLLPYDKSSVSVYLSKDGNASTFIGKALIDIFNWNVVDFSRFSFNGNEAVQDVYTNKKIKKYKRLQFIFENNEPGEPFGLTGFVKTYTIGNFAK